MARGGDRVEWTERKVKVLREIYPDLTISAQEIADRLGVSRGAVFAKAAELGLPSRYPRRRAA
jgi:hypothetical protein